ncbi:MAG: flagellar hook-associated protein FlgK [Deltaproteobacteria bacterium]|nr:flagellar hook-associated protein FlgK [Deltaproteobacteria bacterium]
MAGIYGVFNVGKQALLTQQEAINVTAHNIANVDTEGYSRQRVVTETAPSLTTNVGQIGTGVRVSGIERVYDRYLTYQISEETESLGKWEAKKQALEMAEVVFNESSGAGLNESMSEFWGAWQDLANDPSGQTERQVLLGSAESLANNFQQVYNDLSEIQDDVDGYITQAVDDINAKAAQIGELNEKIVQIEASGDNANDYRDERDLLVKALSEMLDVTGSEEEDGSITIELGDGGKLVDGSIVRELSTHTNDDEFNDVIWADDEDDPPNPLNDSISGGKVSGWLEVRDATIPDYKTNMETLVDTIISEVNTLHAAGYGLDGSTGNNFFVGTLENNDFGVSSTISADVNKIAASATEDGVPGDNGNAVAIADLQNSLTMSTNTATFDDYYNSIVSTVGYDVQQAVFSHDSQEAMVNYLEDYRESISGVSLDEEMINLTEQESAYQAAAKLISTVDEMLSVLLNMV